MTAPAARPCYLCGEPTRCTCAFCRRPVCKDHSTVRASWRNHRQIEDRVCELCEDSWKNECRVNAAWAHQQVARAARNQPMRVVG